MCVCVCSLKSLTSCLVNQDDLQLAQCERVISSGDPRRSPESAVLQVLNQVTSLFTVNNQDVNPTSWKSRDEQIPQNSKERFPGSDV